jgi:branched-chain amino acid aminotransferase
MINIQRQVTSHPKAIPPARELKFGQNFSDHWFYSRYSAERGWYEARIEPYGKIALDPAASVLHYGQALFEGMKAFRQKDGGIAFFRPEFNLRRLHEGAARLCLQPPPAELFMQALRELVSLESRWVPADEGCSLYIRPTLIGSEPFLGVRPAREVLFFILLSPAGPYYSRGQAPTRIWVEDKAVRAAPGGLGATKAGANYAASLQSAQHAKGKGFDQVLWLDSLHEGVEEVGTMNVFFVLKDQIVTPALNGSILAGGMRDSVLQLLRHEGAPVVERRITIGEILDHLAKGQLIEAFGTGTAAVISPIGELYFKGRSHVIHENRPGPLSQRLYDQISGLQRGLLPDTFGWMKRLEKI